MKPPKYIILERGNRYDVYQLKSSRLKPGRGVQRPAQVVFRSGSARSVKLMLEKLLSGFDRDPDVGKLSASKTKARVRRVIPKYHLTPDERELIERGYSHIPVTLRVGDSVERLSRTNKRLRSPRPDQLRKSD